MRDPVQGFNTWAEMFQALREQNAEGRKLFQESAREWQKTLGKGDYGLIDSGYGFIIYCEFLDDIADPAHDEPPTDPMFVWMRAFSAACPEGEMGSNYRTNVMVKISKEMFEIAKARGWPETLQFVVQGRA